MTPSGRSSAVLLAGSQAARVQRERLRQQSHGRLRGNLCGGLIAGLLTAVSTISYSAVAGAPLGAKLCAAAVLAGLVAAALGGAVATWLGSLPTQVFAPRASVAVVIATAVTTFATEQGPTPDVVERTLAMLAVCLVSASLLQVGLGVLRLGGVIRLIPHPVTAGLTIAIALKLVWSQLPQWLGAPGAEDASWLASFLTGVTTLAAIGLAHWRGHSAYAILIGLVVGVAVGAGTGPQAHLAPVQWAEGPLLLPALLRLPEWASRGSELLSPSLFAFAMVIALINSMETLTSVLTLEEAMAQRFDANRALMAGALGSLVSVCVGGLPVAGGAATSVANVRAGGQSRLSALVAALVVVVLAVGGADWVAQIPLAAVAAIMITVAVGLAAAPLGELTQQWRRRYDDPYRICGDLAVAALVGLLMLFTGMLAALGVGVLLATWLALVQMRAGLVRQRYDANEAELPPGLRASISPSLGRTIHVIEIGQPLFFATVETVLRMIEEPAGSVRFVVIDLRCVGAPDATAARSLSRCAATLEAVGRHLVVVRPEQAATIDHALRGCPVFDDLEGALQHCVQEAGDAGAWPSSLSESEHDQGWSFGLLAPAVLSRTATRSRNVQDMLRQMTTDLPAADHAADPLPFRVEALQELRAKPDKAAPRPSGGFSARASLNDGFEWTGTVPAVPASDFAARTARRQHPPALEVRELYVPIASPPRTESSARAQRAGPSAESSQSFSQAVLEDLATVPDGDLGDSFAPTSTLTPQSLSVQPEPVDPDGAVARRQAQVTTPVPLQPVGPQALLPRGAVAPAVAMVATLGVAACAVFLIGLHWHPTRSLPARAPGAASANPLSATDSLAGSTRVRTSLPILEAAALCSQAQTALGLCSDRLSVTTEKSLP